MSAHFDINDNFRKNFCSKAFDEGDDPKLLNVEECRIRTRDVAKSFFSSKSSQESIESKFDKMWLLRAQNWDNLSSSQRKICDQNLRWLSPERYESKMLEQNELQEKRKIFLDSYDMSIKGSYESNLADLKTKLVGDGKAIMNIHGQVVKHENVGSKDEIFIIYCTLEPSEPLRVKFPSTDWHLKNTEDDRLKNMRWLQNRRVLPNVDNEFQYHKDTVFTLKLSKK